MCTLNCYSLHTGFHLNVALRFYFVFSIIFRKCVIIHESNVILDLSTEK